MYHPKQVREEMHKGVSAAQSCGPRTLAYPCSLVCAQVNFCTLWAESVLASYVPLRKRRPASLCIAQMLSTNAAELCTPANARVARLTEHELTDMGMVAREETAKRRGPCRKTSKLSIHKGKCAYVCCPRAQDNYIGPLPVRPQLFCQSCNDGKGSYFHLKCFFAVHRCVRE